MPMNKVVHAAQRAAFSAAIDVAINAVRGKGTEKLSENAVKLVNLAEPLLKDRYPASAFDAARKFVSDPNGKWMQYAYRAINEIDPHVLKMNALNLVYEGMFSGYNYVCELRKKYDCNMPWILLFDPTSACNLHCKGCWAAEYGNRLNLTYEEMDKLVTEGEELGIHWYMCTGGEPMCRKNDLLKLAAKHQSSVFHLFTNGTLIDDAFCEEVKKVGNMAFFLSVEGLDDATDSRRGEGVFQRVMNAMDIMKKHGYEEKERIQEVDGVFVYPAEYFCPLNYGTGKLHVTENTVSIHHYSASWHSRLDDLVDAIERCSGPKGGAQYKARRVLSFPFRVANKLQKNGLKNTIRFVGRKLRRTQN